MQGRIKFFFTRHNWSACVAHNGKPAGEKAIERKITHLEHKLSHKDEVIAEIMHDHVALKKNLA